MVRSIASSTRIEAWMKRRHVRSADTVEDRNVGKPAITMDRHDPDGA